MYLLEHLATFTVSPENDLVYPADGMRRLLAMEKTSGIWTQKVRKDNPQQLLFFVDMSAKVLTSLPPSLQEFSVFYRGLKKSFCLQQPKNVGKVFFYSIGGLKYRTCAPLPARLHPLCLPLKSLKASLRRLECQEFQAALCEREEEKN